jgi:RNA-directed DNA polymerase
MNTDKESQPATVPERTKQAGELRARWHWTEPCVWSERMLEALENGVKGGKWFSLVDKVWKMSNLRAAFEAVKRNDGAAGVDNISIQCFERDLDKQLERLYKELQQGYYQPRPARRKWIDKPGSQTKRPLGIPTVRDRVVEAALKQVIEPIFEHQFHACSYGFRPCRSAKGALSEVGQLIAQGKLAVIEVDIQGYFDHIDHDKLLSLVSEKISDGRVLALIEKMLKRGVMDKDRLYATQEGTPQGGVISPLLANIYLNGLDHLMSENGFQMVRYADDFVILCESKEQTQDCLNLLTTWVEEMSLTLHPEKTGVVDMQIPGSSFDFLGYSYVHTQRGNQQRFVSDKSTQKLRHTLRPYLKRTNGFSMDCIIRQINPILRGWFTYFKESHPNSLTGMSGWVRMRLRSILRKRQKKKGRARGLDHQRWPNTYFEELGLYTVTQSP